MISILNILKMIQDLAKILQQFPVKEKGNQAVSA